MSIVKIRKNFLANLFGLVVGVVVNLIMSPLLLGILGPLVFGVWQAILKVFSIISMVDGRSMQSLKFYIANMESSSENNAKRRILGQAVQSWLLFLPLLIISSVMFYLLAPYYFHSLDTLIVRQVQTVILFLGLNLILGSVVSMPQAILVGSNKGYIFEYTRIAFVALTNVLFLILSKYYGLIGMGISQLIGTVLFGLIIVCLCYFNIAWLGIIWTNIRQIRSYLKFSLKVFGWGLLQKLTLAMDVICITLVLGPEQLVPYSMSNFALQFLIVFALAITSSIIPSIGKAYGSKENLKVAEYVVFLRKALLCVVVFFGISIELCNEYFVTFWVGEDYYIGGAINTLMITSSILFILIRNEGQVQDVTLQIGKKLKIGWMSFLFSFLIGIPVLLISNDLLYYFLALVLVRLINFLMFTFEVNRIIRSNRGFIYRVLIFITFFIVINLFSFGLYRVYLDVVVLFAVLFLSFDRVMLLKLMNSL